MNVQLPRAKYNQQQGAALYQSFLDRVRAIPGVVSASTVTTMMLTTTPNSTGAMAEGRAFRNADPEVTVDVTHPDFFKTILSRNPMGRDFNAADRDSAQPVAIINEHMAKYYWPGAARSASGSCLGARIPTAPESAYRVGAWRICGAPASTCLCAMIVLRSRRTRRSATS
jgi:hypothetical protein